MGSDTISLEAHVDELVSNLLRHIYPVEGYFSVAPQARHLEEAPWYWEDPSLLAADDTEHDIDGVSRRSDDVYSIIHDFEEILLDDGHSVSKDGQNTEIDNSTLFDFETADFRPGRTSTPTFSQSNVARLSASTVPAVNFAPLNILAATTDDRKEQETIPAVIRDRLGRGVVASGKRKHFIPDFHVYAMIQGVGVQVEQWTRYPILIVENKLISNPENQLRLYMTQCLSKNDEVYGLGARRARYIGDHLELILLKGNPMSKERITIIPSDTGELWHK
ncbi:hypothetical protein J3R30DRAFT_1591332 [Lentinula aciculospora]|uniref:Uncharacterized protein n=1 Tax=Lentinula aciculospora TaxID=153920 RepID=A0A9W8ZY60_9AGAR|nr:hypothetical protein J3R30DRAFT_1591332 [Lentinula aciculospora]